MILDQQQQEAVQTQSKNVLVIAPPGSGKTRVIIERSVYLIEHKQVSPYEIVLLTFTRRAANEMRERLEKRIGPKAHKVTIGTFHAVALSLLHRFGDLIGFRKENSTVYGDFEEKFLLREVAKDLVVLKNKTWKIPKKEVDAVFARYYTTGVEPDEEDQVRPLFLAFMARCRENNSYTYGGLLVGLKILLPQIAKYLHWKHIIADEQQDNDQLQWELIRTAQRLCGASVFCVADIDQAIFSWRGAHPEYLVEHQADFDLFFLENNYRSCQQIVDCANRLIRHNKQRVEHVMKATREDIGESRVIVHNPIMDSKTLAAKAKQAIDYYHADANQQSILSRNHKLLQRLSEELEKLEVPHVYVGRKTALTNSEEFRRFHAFLKLLVNPYDNFSFLLIRDLIGLTRQEYAEIREYSASKGCGHFPAWVIKFGGESVFLDDFFIPAMQEKTWSLGASAFAIKYMATGAMPYPSEGFGFDVDESFGFIFSYLMNNPNSTIQQYLTWLATYDVQDEIESDSEGITLSTIHAAKGLEWPVVIVIGCNEGILPSKQAVSSGDVEEERRLMYVAMTRARDQLVLAVRPETKKYGDKVYHNPISRFVAEIG